MNLTERILQDGELRDKPPVLFDIGASTHLPEAWRTLAKYATCVAFDPDARQMGHLETASRDYRKLLVYPAIVHAETDGEVDFYLTRSPECSSTLPPDTDSLRRWRFAPFFEVEKVVKLPAVTLKTVLRETGLDRIDAYKSDTQGTDLRLFRSLPPELGRRILSLEFEPGIIDAYRGEDKLWQLLAAMEKEDDFYLAGLTLHGSVYLPSGQEAKLKWWQRRLVSAAFREAPGWGEARYLNRLLEGRGFGRREYLLGWIFAMIERQPGLALELAEKGGALCGDAFFEEMAAATLRSIPYRTSALKRIWRKIGERFR